MPAVESLTGVANGEKLRIARPVLHPLPAVAPSPMILPFRTTTAPTGTSPIWAASCASSNARSMNFFSGKKASFIIYTLEKQLRRIQHHKAKHHPEQRRADDRQRRLAARQGADRAGLILSE